MKKVYRSVLERALLALLMLYENFDVSNAQLQDWAIGTYYKARAGASPRNQSVQRVVKYLVDLHPAGITSETIAESIDHLLGQLSTGNPAGEGDLIDAMVEVLGFPFMRNILTGRQLQELQKVILLPNELGKVTAQIKEKALKCAGCNHRFQSGEVTTLTFDGSTPSLFCRKCLSPSYTVCSLCDEIIGIDRSIQRALKKECSCGKDHSKLPPQPPPMTYDEMEGPLLTAPTRERVVRLTPPTRTSSTNRPSWHTLQARTAAAGIQGNGTNQAVPASDGTFRYFAESYAGITRSIISPAAEVPRGDGLMGPFLPAGYVAADEDLVEEDA